MAAWGLRASKLPPFPAHGPGESVVPQVPDPPKARELATSIFLEKPGRQPCLKVHILHCSHFLPNPFTSPPEDSESQNPKDVFIPDRCGIGELLLEHTRSWAGPGPSKRGPPGTTWPVQWVSITGQASRCARMFELIDGWIINDLYLYRSNRY